MNSIFNFVHGHRRMWIQHRALDNSATFSMTLLGATATNNKQIVDSDSETETYNEKKRNIGNKLKFKLVGKLKMWNEKFGKLIGYVELGITTMDGVYRKPEK